MNMDSCGGGSETFAWLSHTTLVVGEIACRIDLSGEHPFALDMGGWKTTFLPKGRPVCRLWSEKFGLIRSQGFRDGCFAVS